MCGQPLACVASDRKLMCCFAWMQPLVPVRVAFAPTQSTLGDPADLIGQTYVDSNGDGSKQPDEPLYPLTLVGCTVRLHVFCLRSGLGSGLLTKGCRAHGAWECCADDMFVGVYTQAPCAVLALLSSNRGPSVQ
jgi:hypothetical protein